MRGNAARGCAAPRTRTRKKDAQGTRFEAALPGCVTGDADRDRSFNVRAYGHRLGAGLDRSIQTGGPMRRFRVASRTSMKNATKAP